MELKPADILSAFRQELIRIYGKKHGSACELKYHRSWYYLSAPKQVGGEWRMGFFKPVRRDGTLKLLEALREMPEK